GTISDGPETPAFGRTEGRRKEREREGLKRRERELEFRFMVGGSTGEESSGTLEKWRNCRRGSRLWAGVATGEIRIQLVLHCGSN
ncbi:hypothetical protein K0M31_001049, partial [Melipona bicolor]